MKRLIWMMALVCVSMLGMAQTNKIAQNKTTAVKKTVVTTAQKKEAPKPAATDKKPAAEDKKATAAAQTAVPAPVCGYFCNPPLPYLPPKLDILFIGNSFSIDTSAALPEILNSLGIANVNVYVLYKGGCSMKQHYEYYKSGEKVYELHRFNIVGTQLLEKATSINDVMRRYPYDIVVFQQYSLESGDYNTYEPYLAKLIQAYNITKISSRTTFAFNETWAYASNYKSLSKYKTQVNMWKNICNAIRKMKNNTGIDVIIPCGTAVQNARNVPALNIDNELTRDGLHINLYAGRYLLACTFFESIIAPCLNRSVRDDITIYGKGSDTGQVNNSNRRILQNCARLAVANNYEISEFAGQ
ncbi:MAG: DUF4886 domain-containing protein [Bacteroidaceae bacterium]|nr:DUF4886 domain-containing protein [Bacteroidaceae bacterium]